MIFAVYLAIYYKSGDDTPNFYAFNNHGKNVFISINISKNIYYNNILFDNYYLIYLINDFKRFNSGLLRKFYGKKPRFVKYGTQFVKINIYNIRIINGILIQNRILEFNNITYIKNFHVNIVLKTRLKKNVWYNSLDYIIRIGNIKNNILLCELKRRNNVIFL